eukprot:TRINITY_DN2526_c0_g2_i1.p1 TRINITY_DN2526_c0_g2~~TRINITY_DN2526_c0_g2_i1.p1  ORF type:complete len:507 (-),score=110.73 TRINITY_DN2526_c0_g2_i1:19-1482(-)
MADDAETKVQETEETEKTSEKTENEQSKQNEDQSEERVLEVITSLENLSSSLESSSTALYIGLRPGQYEQPLNIQQSDTTSPLYSAKTFEELGLSEELLKAVRNKNFQKPSKIQEHSIINLIKPLKDGKYQSFIGQAQSGTGKTACFVITMLMRCDPSQKVPQALCVVPTRELAIQIKSVLDDIGKFSNVQSLLIISETNVPSNPTQQILIGTPGRIQNLLLQRKIIPSTIKVFVLDEADLMLDQQGHVDQVKKIKSFLPRNSCQVLLFSATYRKDVAEFADKFVPNPKFKIQLEPDQLTLEQLSQYYIRCRNLEEKIKVTRDLYKKLTVGSSIVFVRTRHFAETLYHALNDEGHEVSRLYGGNMEPAERDRVLEAFRNGTTRVLITTNVIARGIDILEVTLVVNFDLPLTAEGRPDPETYLHRIGRSSRFGRRGIAVNLVHDRSSEEILKKIEEYFNPEDKENKRIKELDLREIGLLEQEAQEIVS